MAFRIELPQRAASERRFFVGMAMAILASVFLGFARSFYLKPVFPDYPAPAEPFFIVHGITFTAWIFLLLAQTTLIARGRTDLHRKAGAAGVALAIVMVVLGVVGSLIAASRPTGFTNMPVPPLQFLAIPLIGLALFTLFFAIAVVRRRDAQSHKRWMMLASIQLVTPAIARWPVIGGLGPLAFFGITDLFVVALVIWDLRTRGRLHPVTLWGGLILVTVPLQLMLAGTETWLRFARWATGLLG